MQPGGGPIASATLIGVTIANNGSGVDSSAGLTLINCTISGNGGDGIYSDENIALYDSTIVNNLGLGLDLFLNQATLANSIVAHNGTLGDVSGSINSLGGNLIGAVGTTGGWIASDQTGTLLNPLDPRLAPLGNYGGLTPTNVPLGEALPWAVG